MKLSLRFYAFVILLASMTGLSRQAFAHAVLQRSNPLANAVVPNSSADNLPIVLTFNSRIDARHSTLSLIAAQGTKPITLTVDKTPEPNILRSVAKGLKPGHYRLQWQVVASDGHMSRGVVPFDVR